MFEQVRRPLRIVFLVLLLIAVFAASSASYAQGVHYRNKLKSCGIGNTVIGACHGDLPGFERLTECLQDRSIKLGQFIQKTARPIGKGDLPKSSWCPTANHRWRLGGMVGASKEPPFGQFAVVEHPRHALNHAHFKNLDRIERRRQ